MQIDRAELERIVREVVSDTLRGKPERDPVVQEMVCTTDGCVPRAVKPLPVRDPDALRKLISATPARVVQGRTGTRYLTRVYCGIRAEHAIALDAVHSEIPDDFCGKLGLIPLRTRAKDKEDYLLFPDHGRRLDDKSRATLEKDASKGVDVQIIAGDGLAPWALLRQGAELIPALEAELKAVGLKTGKPVFVKYARIGVQDEIGVLTQARSTVILVGERPGLGTGDSLSIYTAYGPRLGQDNSEKNCISNVRPLGHPPRDAARMCAELMKKTFEAQGGGLKLVRAGNR
jgi:ethanolamine ammonia-lyase small subunit